MNEHVISKIASIFFVPYQLKWKFNSLNRDGFLLKISYIDGSFGYCDCHPWKELGDLPLSEQLSLLGVGKLTELTARSLFFAEIDAEGRKKGKNLFNELPIPASHWLGDLNNPHCFEGFSRIKLKIGKNLKNDIVLLKQIMETTSDKIKFRLDFNNQLTAKEFEEFLLNIEDGLGRIDFIEDPFLINVEAWKALQNRFSVILAVDRNSHEYLNLMPESIVILKPAIQSESQLITGNKIVVTSYLDHPLGQLAAAYVAAQLSIKQPEKLGICGLASHCFYQTNEFSEHLSLKGDRLVPSQEGSGFGYDDLLAAQKWEKLL